MKNNTNQAWRRASFVFLLAASLACAGCSQSCSTTKQPNSLVEGQLVDQRGRPVSQYAVKCEGTDNRAGWSALAFTDFSGSFQFLDVPPGRYRIYPLNQPAEQGQAIEVRSGNQNIGTVKLPREIKVEFSKEVAKTINEEASKAINPDAAKTLNPEAARMINAEAAKMINPEAAQTINWQAAQTINPEAAKTINPEAARTINPIAAKVLNPERAKVLTKEQALTITAEQARQPLPIP